MAKTESVLSIEKPQIKQMVVEIFGSSPIIFHKWSEKAKRQIREKQAKKAQKGRETRNPEAEYKDSFYYDKDGDIAFPTLCIKQAITNAARSLDGVPMTLLRGNVFVLGDKDGLTKVLVKGKPLKPTKTVINDEVGSDCIYGVDKKYPGFVKELHKTRGETIYQTHDFFDYNEFPDITELEAFMQTKEARANEASI
jgi:hypothetical protein